MLKKCQICDKEFKVKPSHYKRLKNCSKKCMAISYKEQFQGNRNPNWQGGKYHNVSHICLYCNKKFEIIIYAMGKYCSRLCMNSPERQKKLEELEEFYFKPIIEKYHL